MRSDPRAIQQFVDVFRAALVRRLEAVSLDLVDLGLREWEGDVITPGVQQYMIVGWVLRSATGRQSTFMTRIGGQFHQTDPEDVEPMVTDIVMKLVEDFYGPTGG